MREIDYISAQSVSEAAALLNDHGDRARVIAGGTDVIAQVREGRRELDLLVDVKEIAELTAIEYSADSGLRLGAAAAVIEKRSQVVVGQFQRFDLVIVGLG